MPTNEQVLTLLKSVRNDHPLKKVVDLVLLSEFRFPFEMTISTNLSEFKHFTNIYRRRHQRLIRYRLENHGIEESINNMSAHSGQKRVVFIHTQKFNVFAWTDPDLQNLIGLVLVAKQVEEPAAPN